MSMTDARFTIPLSLLGCLCAMPAVADIGSPFFFSTGDPDRLMATASRPNVGVPFEIESADDFVLTQSTAITSATFTGLLPAGATVGDVVVEIYRVFPALSDVGRTTGTTTTPPFQTPKVPTRLNSPSDVELASRDSASSTLSFQDSVGASFTAANSVQPGGIHPKPGQTTGGDGSVTDNETVFTTTFTTPFKLPAGHYFFVPQVQVTGGDFLWLSAARPIAAPGTPFPPGVTDLQSWTRDTALDPDWLRVGQDIVGGTPFPTFNAAFSLTGTVIPEPSTWAMMLLGFAGLGFVGYRQTRSAKLQAA
jgi:hypothetical protein